MSPLASGDLSGLAFPRDLPLLREQVRELLKRGDSLDPLYSALAEQAPMALVDTALGPKAPKGPDAVRAAVQVMEVLASQTSPAGTIRRLGDLAPSLRQELLQDAVARFPAAGWLVGLSTRFDRAPLGQCHLSATRESPNYLGICVAHAKAGHLDALVQEAAAGRPEAVAALALSDTQATLQGAALAMASHPGLRLIPWLAAALGPETPAMLMRLIPRLRSKSAVLTLASDLGPYPLVQARLDLILPGLRG